MKINMKRYFQVLGISLVALFVAALVVLGFNFANTDILGTKNELTPEEIATVEAAGGKVNVLVMGVDKDGLRTDAILLVSYDTEANTIKGLSIPRDTRMYIGSKYQKINAAHAIPGSNGKPLGAQGTVEAVSRLTNVPINYYIDFTFEGIANCIDALGPVEFEIPDLNNDGVGMVYDDPYQDLHINLKPGLQELNGEQCVHLLRYRKGNKINGVRRTYLNGDIDRIAVQQDFVKALVDQKLNASLILKIPSIFKQLSKEINTNLTVKEVLAYSKYLANLSSTDVSIFSLPGQFSGNEYEASYWMCDIEETKNLIETEFGYDASKITTAKSVGSKDKEADKKTSSGKTSTTKSTQKATKAPVSSDDEDDEKKTEAVKKTQTPKPTQKASADESKETKKPTKDDEADEKKEDNGNKQTLKPTEEATKETVKPTVKPTEKETEETIKPTPKPTQNSEPSVPQKKED